MNYTFCENFSVVDKDNMPYSLKEENIHPYKVQSGKVEDNQFLLLRNGARMLFKTPSLESFHFSCQLGYRPPAHVYYSHVGWSIYFGYDEILRTGMVLSINYYENDSLLRINLGNIKGKNEQVEYCSSVSGIKLDGNKMYHLDFSVEENICVGSFDDIAFQFECKSPRGKMGFFNNSSVKGLAYSNIRIESNDVEQKEIVKRKYQIPYYDGGSEEYCIEMDVKKYKDGSYELTYSLTGGAFSRQADSYHMNIWAVQYDVIKNAYIKFYGKCGTNKLFLKNGELCFVEQSPDGKYTEALMDGQKMPFVGKFYLDDFCENDDFAFGYDLFRRLGNELQEDKREFVYHGEELVYSGKSLSEDYNIIIESPKKKKISEMIPLEIDEYEQAKFHALNNHYFLHNEEVAFHIKWLMKRNLDMIHCKVYLLDAFFDEIKDISINKVPIEDGKEYGYTSFISEINLGNMCQGVYHIKAVMYLGDEIVSAHTSAFEVIDDSDISPRESSRIPFMYSGEATPPNIKYNCPDPWIMKPDHNEIHYFDCMLAVPEITEHRKGWKELLGLYKRKMFLWLNDRTAPSEKTYLDYPQSVKLADYTNITSPTAPINYIINPRSFRSAAVRKIYNEFREDRKEYDLFDLSDRDSITDEEFRKLFELCGSEWVDYFCEKNAENLIRFHSSMKEMNPDIKFSEYGPYAIYGTNYSGPYSAKWKMAPINRAEEMMDGFWIFEDYPFITGKETHYSGWGMMGLLMNIPNARIIVELFSSFDPVCPDDCVYNAFPPGGCYVESYRTVTQLNEHMYAAVFRDGKFCYYDNPGFQFLQSYNTEAKQRFEEFLKGWGTYLKNKPKSPMKAPVFITEYINEDDRFEFDFSRNGVNNIGQAGQSYVYGIMAAAGLPKGYCTNWAGLMQLNEDMTDVCVLPSLKYASFEAKQKIRELGAKGIGLIAVSDIADLTDLFGVEKSVSKVKVCALKNDSESELITCREAEFFYKANGAEVLLAAKNLEDECYPVVLKCGKNILINSYICQVGCEDFVYEFFGLANVSHLLKKTINEIVKAISCPLATADPNCGINLFVTESGERRILLTDYSICGCDEIKNVVVQLNLDVNKVRYIGHEDNMIRPNVIKKEGKVIGFSVKLRPGESVIYALE